MLASRPAEMGEELLRNFQSVMLIGMGLAAAMTGDCSSALAQAAPTVWDGVYTEEQADRGKTSFDRTCSPCHGVNLRGTPGGPGLVGGDFQFSFGDKTPAEIFNFAKGNMPPEAPGSLSAQTYVNIVAHILRGNEFPAGKKELPNDPAALAEIRITAKK